MGNHIMNLSNNIFDQLFCLIDAFQSSNQFNMSWRRMWIIVTIPCDLNPCPWIYLQMPDSFPRFANQDTNLNTTTKLNEVT